MADAAHIRRLLDDTVRRERGWLISSLVSRLGPSKVDLAEDVAQDAIVKALSMWPYKGVPDNPRAWLRRVAGNAAIDRIRRSAREFGVDNDWDLIGATSDVITPTLNDPELDLMVLCCDPSLSTQDQLYLALKTVCGFTAAETAALFFVKEDRLSQRLARAKRHLRSQSGDIARYPTRFALNDRLPQLLKVIYLMFAVGYLPRRGDLLFREDLCREAIRLSDRLLAQTDGEAAGHHALHALLLFQAARLPARSTSHGALTTLEHQDRALWDQDMIADGFAQLDAAQASASLTRYHLEAGIAALHAKAETWDNTDWSAIARLYQLLDQYAPSLAVTVNLAVCLILANQRDAARIALDSIEHAEGAQDFPGYHLAHAKLAQAEGDLQTRQAALESAQRCQISTPVEDHIGRELALLINAT